MTDIFEAVARRAHTSSVTIGGGLPWDQTTPEYRANVVTLVRADIRAYLAELEARGFKVVPVVPTEAMLECVTPFEIGAGCRESAARAYGEMLAAAPPAPGSEP